MRNMKEKKRKPGKGLTTFGEPMSRFGWANTGPYCLHIFQSLTEIVVLLFSLLADKGTY